MLEHVLVNLSSVTGIDVAQLRRIVDRGTTHSVPAGTWLFHESTPRDDLVIVEEGEVEVVAGATVTSASSARSGRAR